MKELTIEEKAKRYDELIVTAQELEHDGCFDKITLFDLFPELEESEDERIKKAIKYGLDYVFTNNTTVYETTKEQCLAWLEKQGEHANFRNKIQIGDKVTRNRDGMLVNLSQLNRVAKKDEKQGEQKHDDKVEPKFKVGNWYLCVKDFYGKGVRFDKGSVYYCKLDGCLQEFDSGAHISIVEELYEYFRLWTIQDAKDGDILFQDLIGGKTFIYNGVNPEMAILYSFIINNDGEDVLPYHIGKPNTGIGNTEENKNIIHPATREQRDLLFQKIKEKGYVWDTDKKELKEIEQKPAEWTAEDEEELKIALNTLEEAGQYSSAKWLKNVCLVPRNRWKPTELQLGCLSDAIEHYNKLGYDAPKLKELLEQLKKLRED